MVNVGPVIRSTVLLWNKLWHVACIAADGHGHQMGSRGYLVLTPALPVHSLLPRLIPNGLIALKATLLRVCALGPLFPGSALISSLLPINGMSSCSCLHGATTIPGIGCGGILFPFGGDGRNGHFMWPASLILAGFGRRRFCVFRVLVRTVLVIFFIFIFSVGYDYYLAQDLIQLVTTCLFIASPLDEVVQA
jgi:hypothetical protein